MIDSCQFIPSSKPALKRFNALVTPELFAVSYSDELFLSCGFDRVPLQTYPEKISRYVKVDRTEIEVGEKHCFAMRQMADGGRQTAEAR